MCTRFRLGDAVLVKEGVGIVVYIGKVHFTPGTWVGIELTPDCEPVGHNDGNVDGQVYFECDPGFAVWCIPSSIKRKITPKELLLKIVEVNGMMKDVLDEHDLLLEENILLKKKKSPAMITPRYEYNEYGSIGSENIDGVLFDLPARSPDIRTTLSDASFFVDNKRKSFRLDKPKHRIQFKSNWNEIEASCGRIQQIVLSSSNDAEVSRKLVFLFRKQDRTFWRRLLDSVLRSILLQREDIYCVVEAALTAFRLTFSEFGEFLCNRSLNTWTNTEVVRWINGHGFDGTKFNKVDGLQFWAMSRQELARRAIPTSYIDHLISKRENLTFSAETTSLIEFAVNHGRLYLFREVFIMGDESDGTIGQTVVSILPQYHADIERMIKTSVKSIL